MVEDFVDAVERATGVTEFFDGQEQDTQPIALQVRMNSWPFS